MTHKYFKPKDYDTFIGIDVDKSSFSFTVKDHSTMKKSKKVPANTESFYNYIQKTYPGKKIICAYEAGPTGFHLHDYLTQKNVPCLVVSPLSIPKASNERVKNNRIDSDKIAQHLRSGDLKTIRVPQGPYRELRHLVKTRENYSSNRKVAKQRIKLDTLHNSRKERQRLFFHTVYYQCNYFFYSSERAPAICRAGIHSGGNVILFCILYLPLSFLLISFEFFCSFAVNNYSFSSVFKSLK